MVTRIKSDAEVKILRTLIVDEYPLSRATLPRFFAPYGYVCAVAATAQQADEALQTFAPDVVVLDWTFRDGSGVGLASRLRARASDAGRRLFVVVLSVVDEPTDFRAREGVDHYFVKPALIESIDGAIRLDLRSR